MANNHKFNFGMPVTSVAAGYYPFDFQIWAFAGNSNANPSDWIVNLQGYVRFLDRASKATTNGFTNIESSIKVFGTDNITIDTNQLVMAYTTAIHYEQNNLPMDIRVNVLDALNQNVLQADHIQFTVGSSGNPHSPIAVELVDMQFETKLNLLGSTEVVIIDPIF